MIKFSLKSIALKWYYFSCMGTIAMLSEYFNLFMKQLGFNPAQIGVTALFGIPNLLIPLCLLLGEKFRARKIVTVFGTLGASVCCMLPLLSLIVPALQAECYNKPSVNNNGSVHLWNRTSKKAFKAIQKPVLTDLSNTSWLQITASKPYAVHSINPSSRTRIADKKIKHSKPQLRSSHASLTTQTVWGHNVQMFSKYSKNTKRLAASKLYHSLRFKRTLKSSVPTTYSSQQVKQSSNIYNPQSMLSALFLLLTISRCLTQLFERVELALANLVTMTHIREEKASYGVYSMWSHIGATLSVFCVAVLARYIGINICGVSKYGYFVTFIWGGIMFALSMLSLPWFTFEYNKKKTFTWSGIKSDIFNTHYILMFGVLFYVGMCMTFQTVWEFWYLDGLSASPLLIAVAVLVRRPLLATSMFMSYYCIRKIGDLRTICVALLLYACSYLALSFTRIAWLVIVIDTFQAAAYGFGYCAMAVLFSKAASKQSASVIFGLLETVYIVGFEVGSTVMGVLFHSLGTRLTLLIFSISSAVVLVMLVLYIRFSTSLHKYEKVAQDSDDE